MMPKSGQLLKLCLTATLLAGELLLLSPPAGAAMKVGESPLCKARKAFTVLGFTTKSFHVAICDTKRQFLYIGEDRKHRNRIVLPAYKINAETDPEGAIFDHFIARNGAYTYDVDTDYSRHYVFGKLSVFQGSRRILYQTSDFAFGDEAYFP